MRQTKKFWGFIILGISSFIFIFLTYSENWQLQNLVSPSWIPSFWKSRVEFHPQCTDVITKMLQGHWEEQNVTTQEKSEMFEFYNEVLKRRGVAYGLIAPGGVCGNVSKNWFRALCHPGGPTPCCYNFRCVNATKENCTCDKCYDLRANIEAEHAIWRAEEPACQPLNLPVETICQLLSNATVYFIGDSLVRHIYVGFVMQVKGREDSLFQDKKITRALLDRCRGRTIFTDIGCRPIIMNGNPHLCNDTITTKYMELRGVRHAKGIQQNILELGNRSQSLVVFGFGLDDRYDFAKVKKGILTPLMQEFVRRNLTWPKLVWTTPHIIGIINAQARNSRQDLPHLTAYTNETIRFWTGYHVPVLSSYNITMNVMSHDGTHHGLAVNRMRGLVLLHHIQELRQRHQW